jgi:hypothetical protein
MKPTLLLIALAGLYFLGMAVFAEDTLTNRSRIRQIHTRAERLAVTVAPVPINTFDLTAANFPACVRDTGVALLVIDSLHQVWVGNKMVGTVTKCGWVAAP